jgi:hypothetical protein
MKEEFNKDSEILKKKFWKWKPQWRVPLVEWIKLKTDYQDSATR